MQETLIVTDAALGARLQACRQLFLRLDAGTAEALYVRLPDGNAARLGLGRGQGLSAAGALLAYALLGREDPDAAARMDALRQQEPDRSLRKLCQLAADMLAEDERFSQASLYAALRTAAVLLPEGGNAAELPGLVRSEEKEQADQQPAAALAARYAWAENAAIAYFDLPQGVEEARIGDTAYSRAQCRAGVCLPPDTEEIAVEWPEGSALLRPTDPLFGFHLTVGFRWGKVFVPAQRMPKRLWSKAAPCIRVLGAIGQRTPEMAIATSAGSIQENAVTLPQGIGYLRCPGLDPRKDERVELRLPAVRYLDLTGED